MSGVASEGSPRDSSAATAAAGGIFSAGLRGSASSKRTCLGLEGRQRGTVKATVSSPESSSADQSIRAIRRGPRSLRELPGRLRPTTHSKNEFGPLVMVADKLARNSRDRGKEEDAVYGWDGKPTAEELARLCRSGVLNVTVGSLNPEHGPLQSNNYTKQAGNEREKGWWEGLWKEGGQAVTCKCIGR